MNVKDLIRYMFGYFEDKPERHAVVDDVAKKGVSRKSTEVPTRSGSLSWQVKGANRVLAVICIASFVYIAVFPFLSSGGETPDVIQNAFWLIIGYFGSAVVTFLEGNATRS